jgi:hypothetical protein
MTFKPKLVESGRTRGVTFIASGLEGVYHLESQRQGISANVEIMMND